MVYKDCDIGSAKPDKKLLIKYPHHLINVLSPNEVFTVGDFYSLSKNIIKEVHKKNKLPIFVGGSMMYFKSLYKGMHDLPKRDQRYRNKLKKLKCSNEEYFLFKKLKEIDPNYAKNLNKNDEVRIVRALEVHKNSGIKMSEIILRDSENSLSKKYNVEQFCILHDRSILHKRIKDRLDKIIEYGLLDEAKNLLKSYKIDLDHPLRKSINYRQAFDFLEKKYNYDTFYETALFATRQLAKRQITWIRSWDEFTEINSDEYELLHNRIKKLISAL